LQFIHKFKGMHTTWFHDLGTQHRSSGKTL